MQKKILVTVCARKGSKGLPGKNIRPMLGKPLLAHTVDQAVSWSKSTKVVFSTDSEEMAELAKKHGAAIPFLRPEHLSNDTIGKLPVLTHALRESEKFFGEKFDILLDLDVTSPIRTHADLERGLEAFLRTGCDACFSVVKARKNPYFNMVERNQEGEVRLSKALGKAFLSRQAAPKVWDMNACIYFYKREFLLSDPAALWAGRTELFEMGPESAFDIDEERDFVLVEALMKYQLEQK